MKKTFLFVSAVIFVLFAFAGCESKPKMQTEMTYDYAIEIFFNKNASSSDIKIAGNNIKEYLAKNGETSEGIEEFIGNLREAKTKGKIEKYGMTTLMIASAIGNPKLVKELIAQGADVNARDKSGFTVLMQVGSMDYPHPKSPHKEQYHEIVKMLIAAGADVNAKTDTGLTVLMTTSDAKSIKELIAAGADVNAIGEYGDTALANASSMGDNESVKVLIAAGADVNIKTKSDLTALMGATLFGHTEVVKTLIAAGADVNVVTKSRETCLSIAKSKGYSEIVKILQQAGAK